MPRPRPRSATVTVAVLGAALLLSGAGTAAADPSGGVTISTAPSRLADAERQRHIADDAVRGAVRQLDDLAAREQTATEELAGLATDLDTATAGLAAARATEDRHTDELAAADAELAAAEAVLERGREQVADRAVEAFKFGSRSPAGVVFRGLGGAGDLHEAALTVRVVDRISRDDQAQVAATVRLVERARDVRLRAETVRAATQAATAAAEERRRELETLIGHQTELRDLVATERANRARVLADLEADADARAAIVGELEAAVDALAGGSVSIRVPVRGELDRNGPVPDWASALPTNGRAYAAAIEATAARHGIDGRLLAALVWTESGFRPSAVSHAGAIGLAQLMPATARGLGVDPYDMRQNLDGGARFLATQLDTFGRVELALAAYNAGPARVAKLGRVPAIVETQLYVVRVLDRYRTLTGT